MPKRKKPKRSQPKQKTPPAQLIGAAGVVLGLALLAASFFVSPDALAGYSQDEAVQYQQASVRLHELSARPKARGQEVQQQRELRDAQGEFVELKARLDAARSRGPLLAQGLRYGGAALVLAGVLSVAISSRTSVNR